MPLDKTRGPDRGGPPKQAGPVTAARHAHEARSVASIEKLIVERRRLRVRPSPISSMSVDDKNRLAAIDAELDELWTELRRARSPMRNVPAPTGPTAPRPTAARGGAKRADVPQPPGPAAGGPDVVGPDVAGPDVAGPDVAGPDVVLSG